MDKIIKGNMGKLTTKPALAEVLGPLDGDYFFLSNFSNCPTGNFSYRSAVIMMQITATSAIRAIQKAWTK